MLLLLLTRLLPVLVLQHLVLNLLLRVRLLWRVF